MNKETAKGEGFIMRELTPEEKIKSEQMDSQELLKSEEKRTENFTAADYAEDMLGSMLKTHNPYSETFKIKLDGTLDRIYRIDGSPVYFNEGDTPEEFYQIAAEIQKKHPEYQFKFERDPEGRWLKYVVSKTEKGKS